MGWDREVDEQKLKQCGGKHSAGENCNEALSRLGVGACAERLDGLHLLRVWQGVNNGAAQRFPASDFRHRLFKLGPTHTDISAKSNSIAALNSSCIFVFIFFGQCLRWMPSNSYCHGTPNGIEIGSPIRNRWFILSLHSTPFTSAMHFHYSGVFSLQQTLPDGDDGILLRSIERSRSDIQDLFQFSRRSCHLNKPAGSSQSDQSGILGRA
jgi:hypothetical protein